MNALLVEVTRGPLVEQRHYGAVAVVDEDGALLLAAGDPDLVAYWRSSAKPFQAAAAVAAGAADRFGLAARHLAVMCASHNGEEEHIRVVLDLLQRVGLGPEALRCGAAAPLDRSEAEALMRRGEAPTPLHNNCSGKHAGMLALARHIGADPDTYLDPAHPVQRLVLAQVSAATGLAAEAIVLGVDGCGVPTFGLPLRHMALAFARLAGALDGPLARVRGAMTEEPYLVAGRGRLCTELMQAFAGALVAKSGAAGVYGIGLAPELARRSPLLAAARGGVGIALKVEDGAGAPRDAVTVAVLDQLGLLDLLPEDRAARLRARQSPPVRNAAGREVGTVRPVLRLRP